MPLTAISDFLKSTWLEIVATGLLGLLWRDVRKVNRMKEIIIKDIEKDFLTKKEHNLLCRINHLEFDKTLEIRLNGIKDEILDAIKDIRD